MAIGVAQMLGYDLPRNFRMPYLAMNITEFWRRWHITLSTWLRDYLYIPLGGNRQGRARTYRNLMLTMLLGGLWHGASWNFVLWGGLHGVALALHRAAKELTGERRFLPAPLAIAVTFVFALCCWVPFRSPDWATTTTMLGRMFAPGTEGVLFVPTALLWCSALLLAGHAVGAALDGATARPNPRVTRWLDRLGYELRHDPISGWYVVLGLRSALGAFVLTTWLLSLYYFAPTGTSPFIYFQF